MNTRIVKSSAVLGGVLVAVLAGASMARAQERITAKVPFSFIVNDVEMAAGDYVVREVPDGSGVLQIQSADGEHTTFTNTIPASSSVDYDTESPKLQFTQYNGRHFLARVTNAEGNTSEIQLDSATMDREIAAVDGNAK